jgi:hypothetical protein
MRLYCVCVVHDDVFFFFFTSFSFFFFFFFFYSAVISYSAPQHPNNCLSLFCAICVFFRSKTFLIFMFSRLKHSTVFKTKTTSTTPCPLLPPLLHLHLLATSYYELLDLHLPCWCWRVRSIFLLLGILNAQRTWSPPSSVVLILFLFFFFIF